MRSHLQFQPRVRVTLPAPGRIEAERDGVRLRIGHHPGLRAQALRGDEARPAGWYSPLFGIREPAWAVCLTRAAGDATPLDLLLEWPAPARASAA